MYNGQLLIARQDAGDGLEPADLIAAGKRVPLFTEPAVAEGSTLEGVSAATEMLAGWLKDARAQANGPFTLAACSECGFTLPCPWGC